MKVVFSIPAHESVAVVHDTVRNIKRYCPSAKIVLHANPGFSELTEDAISAYDFVYLNPVRHPFAWGESLINIHHSNFRHALTLIEDFDYFCLYSSNQMFVCDGFEDHIAQYRAGVQLLPSPKYYCEHLRSSNRFRDFMMEFFLDRIYKGHWEGSYFAKELFEKIDHAMSKYFLMDGLAMHLEEFVYPMLVSKFCQKSEISSPACYVDIGIHKGLRHLDIAVVDEIVSRSKGLKLSGLIRARKIDNIIRYVMRDIAIYRSVSDIFMVKRVARDMHDPLRKYINNL